MLSARYRVEVIVYLSKHHFPASHFCFASCSSFSLSSDVEPPLLLSPHSLEAEREINCTTLEVRACTTCCDQNHLTQPGLKPEPNLALFSAVGHSAVIEGKGVRGWIDVPDVMPQFLQTYLKRSINVLTLNLVRLVGYKF